MLLDTTCILPYYRSFYFHSQHYFFNTNLLKIKRITGTTSYQSENVASLSVDHGITNSKKYAIAKVTSASSIKDFPYNIATSIGNEKVSVYLFSASKWTTSNSSVDVDVLIFYI